MPPKKTISTRPVLKLDEKIIDAHFTTPGARFFNRELSWLAFNTRVLEEACNPHLPLLERVRFLSISASNLDEFYMVRVAGLKDQQDMEPHAVSIDGLTAKQQLAKIHDYCSGLMAMQQRCWLHLQHLLQQEAIHMVRAEDLSERDKTWLRGYFEANIFPLLTPIAVDPAHPFPFVPNLGMVHLFEIQRAGKKSKKLTALIPYPLKLERFVKLGTGKGTRFMLVEHVTEMFLHMVFPGYEMTSQAMFRIVRDSDLDIADDAENFMHTLDSAVKKRRLGRIVRLKTSRHVPPHLLEFMLKHLRATQDDVVEVEGMVGLVNTGELTKLVRPDLLFKPFTARHPERLNDYGGDCFAAIAAKDFVIHHPFESFDVVVQFLNQAADDPEVVSIKQTLYRTSQDSPIVRALIRAAEAGKAVTALVELKARFDEEANIRFARDMERVGVQVVFGFVNLKTHAKISLIARREKNGIQTYAHFGTGNYHPHTAKVYTDLSFFTCDVALCQDAAYLFNYITGYGKPRSFKKISAAPLTLRRNLLRLIGDEIQHARAGKPAAIWAKMNSLIDPEMIDALYVASQAGVDIELVVRGTCGVKPGIPGFSDRIVVKSIVGRFLEHSRIFAFGAGYGLPSPNAKLFMASADWMTRNLDHRVEIMIPIENPTVHAQILDQIMVANLNDERQSWILGADGVYHRLKDVGDAFAAHDYFMFNPSLSGRGKVLQKMLTGQEEAPPAVRKAPIKRGRK